MIGTKPTTQRNGRQAYSASVYGTEGYWFEPSGVYFGSYARIVGGLCTDGKWALFPDAKADTLGDMDMPIKLPAGRKLCSTIEAAEIYGCSGTHVRGMASRGEIWSQQVTQRAWLYDSDEIQQLAKEREKLRAAGKLCGRRPGHRQSA